MGDWTRDSRVQAIGSIRPRIHVKSKQIRRDFQVCSLKTARSFEHRRPGWVLLDKLDWRSNQGDNNYSATSNVRTYSRSLFNARLHTAQATTVWGGALRVRARKWKRCTWPCGRCGREASGAHSHVCFPTHSRTQQHKSKRTLRGLWWVKACALQVLVGGRGYDGKESTQYTQ